MALHQQKGVQFCMEEEVAEFSGDTSLEAVLLRSDRRLKADLVVVGVGVTPATNIAGLPTDSRGEILVKFDKIFDCFDLMQFYFTFTVKILFYRASWTVFK